MRRLLEALTCAEPVIEGAGRLEALLADLRARMADRLIPPDARAGRLLDIGCGRVPWFLRHTRFAERYGLDPAVRLPQEPALRVQALAAGKGAPLPFTDAHFDIVTMLAVLEHLPPGETLPLLREVRRVLRPRGRLILTTPSALAALVLPALAACGLISRAGLDEHQQTYHRRALEALCRDAGFAPSAIRTGAFECGFNLWAVAERGPAGGP